MTDPEKERATTERNKLIYFHDKLIRHGLYDKIQVWKARWIPEVVVALVEYWTETGEFPGEDEQEEIAEALKNENTTGDIEGAYHPIPSPLDSK